MSLETDNIFSSSNICKITFKYVMSQIYIVYYIFIHTVISINSSMSICKILWCCIHIFATIKLYFFLFNFFFKYNTFEDIAVALQNTVGSALSDILVNLVCTGHFYRQIKIARSRVILLPSFPFLQCSILAMALDVCFGKTTVV